MNMLLHVFAFLGKCTEELMSCIDNTDWSAGGPGLKNHCEGIPHPFEVDVLCM